MRSAVHLGRWMDSRNIGIGGLNQVTIARFTRHKCRCPGVWRHGQCPSGRTVARVRQFTEHLIRLGVILPPATPSPRSLPSPLTGFRGWMTRQRGIKAQTIDRYERLIERMLPLLGNNPAKYDASLVRQSLLRTVKELSCGYAKTLCHRAPCVPAFSRCTGSMSLSPRSSGAHRTGVEAVGTTALPRNGRCRACNRLLRPEQALRNPGSCHSPPVGVWSNNSNGP